MHDQTATRTTGDLTKMKHCAKLATLAAILAAPAAMAAVTEADRAAFIAAVAENGCKLDFTEMMAVLGPVGLDRDDARAIALPMVQAGDAEINPDQVLILKTGPCS